MKTIEHIFLLVFIFLFSYVCLSQPAIKKIEDIPYSIYPEVNQVKPDLPSPFTIADGHEYVVAVTKENKYAIIEVTLDNEDRMCPQLLVDGEDFPYLVEHGIHAEEELNNIRTITGWSVDTITTLGRPGGLSQAGFMAADEDILSVIRGDNDLVKKLGFTHPPLARPLFHVLNMMDTDLSLGRWNMALHQWENIQYFYYHDQQVLVKVEDTKGGQKSIFNDGIQGGFYIQLWTEMDEEEMAYLRKRYNHLTKKEMETLIAKLSHFNTGEIQPQYIMRYGFYEGHTYWRADPITIAFIFGLKSLSEIDQDLGHDLYSRLTHHY